MRHLFVLRYRRGLCGSGLGSWHHKAGIEARGSCFSVEKGAAISFRLARRCP